MRIISDEIIGILIESQLFDITKEDIVVDYAPPVQADIAFILSSRAITSPPQIDALLKCPWIAQATIVERYLNLTLDLPRLFRHVAGQLAGEGIKYALGNTSFETQKIVVEHTSINPVYPINVGTFRSTAIGHALYSLLSAQGVHVETHFWAESLARQQGVILDALEQLDLSPQDLESLPGKPDHVLGAIFTSAIQVSRGVSIEDVHQMVSRMFPKTGYIPELNPKKIQQYNLMEKTNREKTSAICNYCIEGFKQTLAVCGIHIDSYDVESKGLAVYSRAQIRNFSEGSKEEDSEDREDRVIVPITYETRNVAYYHSLLQECDLVISVVPARQKAILEPVASTALSLFHEDDKGILLKYFGDVFIEPDGYDSIKKGQFNSVDETLEVIASVLDTDRETAAEALKFCLLDSRCHKVRNLDIRNPHTYSRFRHVRQTITQLESSLSSNKVDNTAYWAEMESKLVDINWSEEAASLLKTLALLSVRMSNAVDTLEPHIIIHYTCELASKARKYMVLQSNERLSLAFFDLTLRALKVATHSIGLNLVSRDF